MSKYNRGRRVLWRQEQDGNSRPAGWTHFAKGNRAATPCLAKARAARPPVLEKSSGKDPVADSTCSLHHTHTQHSAREITGPVGQCKSHQRVNKEVPQAGGVVQWLRACTALVEGLGSVPGTHSR